MKEETYDKNQLSILVNLFTPLLILISQYFLYTLTDISSEPFANMDPPSFSRYR